MTNKEKAAALEQQKESLYTQRRLLNYKFVAASKEAIANQFTLQVPFSSIEVENWSSGIAIGLRVEGAMANLKREDDVVRVRYSTTGYSATCTAVEIEEIEGVIRGVASFFTFLSQAEKVYDLLAQLHAKIMFGKEGQDIEAQLRELYIQSSAVDKEIAEEKALEDSSAIAKKRVVGLIMQKKSRYSGANAADTFALVTHVTPSKIRTVEYMAWREGEETQEAANARYIKMLQDNAARLVENKSGGYVQNRDLDLYNIVA